jgi:hypothetical protein
VFDPLYNEKKSKKRIVRKEVLSLKKFYFFSNVDIMIEVK